MGLEYAAIDGMGQARTFQRIYFIAELACDRSQRQVLQCQHSKRLFTTEIPAHTICSSFRLPACLGRQLVSAFFWIENVGYSSS